MTRREGDEEAEDWRSVRKRDVESFGKWIIGVLLVIVGIYINEKLDEIKQISLDNQRISTGLTRESQIRDSSMASLRFSLSEHIAKHPVSWTEEEKKQWEAIKQEIYLRWGYISVTRGNEQILHTEPMKGDLQ